MIKRRLTDDERGIRRSRGIALWRFWPFGVMFAALMVLNLDSDLFVRCIGKPLNAHSGGLPVQKIAALVRMVGSIPCSIYAFRSGSWLEHLSAVGFFAAIPFAFLQIQWMQRHKTYWDEIRAREKLKRQETRHVADTQKKSSEQTGDER